MWNVRKMYEGYDFFLTFICFSFTLLSVESSVDRGKLVLGHSVPNFLPIFVFGNFLKKLSWDNQRQLLSYYHSEKKRIIIQRVSGIKRSQDPSAWFCYVRDTAWS